MISPSRSRSGSNCWASLSGISMVNCIALSLTDVSRSVKPGGSPHVVRPVDPQSGDGVELRTCQTPNGRTFARAF
jgi:hypothetical protein